MTTVVIHVSHGNRAGSFFENNHPARFHDSVGENKECAGGYVCQEADQHLRSARRNTHGNRDKGTRQSAGTSESRRRRWRRGWIRWVNCMTMLAGRQGFLTLGWN